MTARRRNGVSRTSLAAAASNPDVIAAFAFTVDWISGKHTYSEAHGEVDLWRSAAHAVARVGWCACTVRSNRALHIAPARWDAMDEEHVRVRLGDAQTCCYARSGRYALVFVLPPNSSFIKSVHRTCRRVLAALHEEAAT